MDVKNSYLDTENALWANSFALNYLLKHDRTDLSMLELRLCPSHTQPTPPFLLEPNFSFL